MLMQFLLHHFLVANTCLCVTNQGFSPFFCLNIHTQKNLKLLCIQVIIQTTVKTLLAKKKDLE